MIRWGQDCFVLSGDFVGDEVVGPFRWYVVSFLSWKKWELEVKRKLGIL